MVERGQVVLADAAGLMGEGRRREQRGVLGVRPARSGHLGADHRGVAGVRVVVARGASRSARLPARVLGQASFASGAAATNGNEPARICLRVKFLAMSNF